MNYDWTEARTESLKALWHDGKSASQIRDVLGGGLSRSAISGKLDRLGLKRGKEQADNTRAARAVAARIEAKPRRDGWSLEQIDTAKRMRAEGRSFGAIGGAIGRSRDAVQAKLFELGVRGRTRSKSVDQVESLKAAASLVERFACEAAAEPAPDGVTLLDLTQAMCRWPLGDPKEASFRFCGCTKQSLKRPYCAEHAGMASEPVALAA
ncbi:MAG: hypothetical protein JO107_00085 [Hyphomicrobiales bacterium]|nr:hypothetical protein [Hyphomicrobiales bacterium]